MDQSRETLAQNVFRGAIMTQLWIEKEVFGLTVSFLLWDFYKVVKRSSVSTEGPPSPIISFVK